MKTVFGFNNGTTKRNGTVNSSYVAEKSLIQGILRIADNGLPSVVKANELIFDSKEGALFVKGNSSGVPKRLSSVSVVNSLSSIGSSGKEDQLYIGKKEEAVGYWDTDKKEIVTLYYTKDEIDNKILKAITDDNEIELNTYLKKTDADKTYVKQDDAVVEDGDYIKASGTVGQNLANLDAALTKETSDRASETA